MATFLPAQPSCTPGPGDFLQALANKPGALVEADCYAVHPRVLLHLLLGLAIAPSPQPPTPNHPRSTGPPVLPPSSLKRSCRSLCPSLPVSGYSKSCPETNRPRRVLVTCPAVGLPSYLQGLRMVYYHITSSSPHIQWPAERPRRQLRPMSVWCFLPYHPFSCLSLQG